MNKLSKNFAAVCLAAFLLPAFFASAQEILIDPGDTRPIQKVQEEIQAEPRPWPEQAFRLERKKISQNEGASTPSEAAVARGLLWLSLHQFPDGGWSFDHTKSPKCEGKCENPGTMPEARNAATALAILPFLGSGITHKEGTYRLNVRNGLYYLGKNMKPGPGKGGSLYEEGGTMYSHGLATLCLTEAYAMTKDRELQKLVQAAIDFIVYAQDRETGGWRPTPEQNPDISVTGLQLQALKSGYMAYLKVPTETTKNAATFLDSLQSHDGAFYGHDQPGEDKTATATGLLLRMFYGWKKDNPALQKGVEWLAEHGPANDDVYHNYFTTLLMHHYGGPHWEKWHSALIDQLVATQVSNKESHEYGSWYSPGEKSSYEEGGRHYQTALSVMTLEVYYRHAPMYKAAAVSDTGSRD